MHVFHGCQSGDDEFEFLQNHMMPRDVDQCQRLPIEEIAARIPVEYMGKAHSHNFIHFATHRPVGQHEIISGDFEPSAIMDHHCARLEPITDANTLEMICIRSLLDLFSRHTNAYHIPSGEGITRSDLDRAYRLVHEATGHTPNVIWQSRRLAAVMILDAACIKTFTAEMYNGSPATAGVFCLQPNSLLIIRT